MKTTDIFRLCLLGGLWLLLVSIVVRTCRMDFFTVFAIVASGIIVFVPLFKKYNKNGK